MPETWGESKALETSSNSVILYCLGYRQAEVQSTRAESVKGVLLCQTAVT